MINRRFSYLVLVGVVLLAYMPAIHSGVCSADDTNLLKSLGRLNDWDMFRHFFPNRSSGNYYRPLLTSTYVMDRFLWDASPLMMHLENVLLHIINSILVFELTRIVLRRYNQESLFLPLFTGLLFGLHPLTVESVAWISGRTDVLCATFVFLSAIALLKYKFDKNILFLLFACISLFLGFLTKEVAVAFLPGAALILWARQPHEVRSRTGKSWKKIAVQTAFVVGGVTALFFGYVVVRDLAFSEHSSRLGLTLQVIFNDLYYAMFVVLRALGFYIKKVFIPYPLNFAIVQVDPLYELFAIPFVLLFLWLLVRRELRSSLLLAGVGLVAPAFLLAFGQIAWTHYAERYLYVPLGFILPALICFLAPQLSLIWDRHSKVVIAAGLALLVVMAGSVFHRSTIWQSNLSLFADTTRKSPWAKSAWNQYGVALYKNGELEKALASFEKASTLNSRIAYKATYDTNRAAILERLGREDEAIELLREVVQRPRGQRRITYVGLIDLLENKIARLGEGDRKNRLIKEVERYREKIR